MPYQKNSQTLNEETGWPTDEDLTAKHHNPFLQQTVTAHDYAELVSRVEDIKKHEQDIIVNPKKITVCDLMYQDPASYATSYKGTQYIVNSSEQSPYMGEEYQEQSKQIKQSALNNLKDNELVQKFAPQAKEHISNPPTDFTELPRITFETTTDSQDHLINLSKYKLNEDQKTILNALIATLNFEKDITQKNMAEYSIDPTLMTRDLFEALKEIRNTTREYKDKAETCIIPNPHEDLITGVFKNTYTIKATGDFIKAITQLSPKVGSTSLQEITQGEQPNRDDLQEKRRKYIETSANNKRLKAYIERREAFTQLCDKIGKNFNVDTRSWTKSISIK